MVNIKIFILACAALLLSYAEGSAQGKLGVMTASRVKKDPSTVVRDKGKALLSIFSEIDLSGFESNLGIGKIEKISAHEWVLFLLPMRQRITIKANGYRAVHLPTTGFELKTYYRVEIKSTRTPTGLLQVFSKPANANILLDGIHVGTTPYINTTLPMKKYKVQIEQPGYAPADTTLHISAGGKVMLDFELQKTAVPVAIVTENDLTGVAVFLNERRIGEAPGTFFITPGTHKLRFQKEGFNILERETAVEIEQENVTLPIKMKKRSSIFARKWFWFGSAVTAGGLFVISRSKIGPAADSSLLPESPDFPGT